MDVLSWLAYLWSPLWFFWDLCGTVGILLLVRRWIKGSVTATKDQVIAELKDAKCAAEVRQAWGIPTLAEIRAAIPPLPAVPTVAEIREGLKTTTKEAQGMLGAMAKEDKALALQVQQAYANTPQGRNDAQALAVALHRAAGGYISPNQAMFVSAYGPMLGEQALSSFIGPKRAHDAMTAATQALMVQMQGGKPGGYQ